MTEDETQAETQDEQTELEAVDGLEDVDLPDRSGQGGGHDPAAIPYHHVNVDHSKPYEAFSWAERRAVLLKRIERAGHPQALPQTYGELGDEFGVSKTQIHSDMKVLAAYTAENLDRDHKHIMDSVFRGAIRDLVDEGKMAWASEVGKEWYDWLAQMGEVERVADKHELEASISTETSSEDYEVIEDDADPADVIDVEGGPAQGDAVVGGEDA